jgi:hypothetical protein
MARNINRRLTSLKARRSGTDRLNRIATMEQAVVIAKSLLEESYQKRAPNRPYTRYALGAMQEVGPDYTRISIETAERVQNQLATGLSAAGRNVGFRLQGSVPCNIHIRGVSDVDLLTLDEAFHTYDQLGLRAQLGGYRSPTSYTPLSALQSLRGHVERILKVKFPAAEVDTSGGKAVKISGGSLARPVDVVLSHWHDTADYQRTFQEHDRGVRILDKKVPTTVDNMPFRHIKRISDQDTLAFLSLKKAIRLCKNVKSDAEEEGTNITLPSFDIAATMYYADLAALRMGATYELAILAETQRHLDALACNFDLARTLMVPDGSRRIFDTEAKLHGLRSLSIEMDDLLREVAKEQNYLLGVGREPTIWESRDTVTNVYVPAA